LLICSCDGGNPKKEKALYTSLNDVPVSRYDKLSEMTIFFGHQSVGYNIIEGVQDVMKTHPNLKLKIVEGRNPDMFMPGTLVHSKVGKNTKPDSKLREFSNILQSGAGKKIDACALKFCYVDIRKNTDTAKLFAAYEKEIEKIRRSFPNLTIIHFTAPLTRLQSGFKAWLKTILGRPLRGMEDNIKRHEFNEMLRSKYRDKDPIFDIAQIESTYPDGSRSSFEHQGKTYYSLVPDYTDDGCHLNKTGREAVAKQFILQMLNL
jgi:hypothetical protein